MRKIFYNPDTLEIKCMTDGDEPVDFPYVTTKKNYHSFENLKIKIVDGDPKILVVKGTLDTKSNNK